MKLQEYIKDSKSWKLSTGELQNLLDEAIDRIEKLEARIITIDMLKRCKDDDAWIFASNLNALLQGDRQ